MDILNKLEEITPNLPRLDKYMTSKEGNMFELGAGGSRGTINFCLLNIEDVAVINASLRQGDHAPVHGHDAKEWIIVYRGKLKITTSAGTDIFEPGDYIFINNNEEHSVLALEDSWVVAITVPTDENFPK